LTSAPDLSRSPLLERDQELGLFEELLSESGDAAERLVIVEGPAGIGKSRLIAELRDRAAGHDLRVLAANGSDLERDFPFGVVRQLFDPLLADPGRDQDLLSGAAASAASVFTTIDEGAAGAEDVSFAALHGLYWLTLNVASEEPLMLVVDDLHWCDRPSLRFLAYLSRRLEGLGGLLVVGLRTAEPGIDPLLLGEVVSQPDALHVHPGPLSTAGVGGLITSRLGAEPEVAFTEACLSATGGNPLLLRQLLSSLEADGVSPDATQVDAVTRVGPRAVSRTVLLRLRRLPAEATAVARAVAILGTNTEVPLVAAVAEVVEPAVARASAQLSRAEILGPEMPLRFVHPLVRDAVYHELPSAERELWHARAAQVLAARALSAEAIATQLLAAPRRGEEWVVDRLVEAASAARRKGAADSAIAYLDRAVAEPPPDARLTRVLLELGRTETLTSGPAAAAHLSQVWTRLDDPRERASVAAMLARTLMFTAGGVEAVEIADRALAEAPPDLIDERQALRALRLMAIFFAAGDQSEMERLDTIEIVGDGPGAKMLAAITSFARSLTGGNQNECVPMALEALADGILIEVDPGLFPVAAITVLVFADRDEAVTAWDELRARAYRGGSLLGILTVGLWRGVTLMWRGDLTGAQESLEGARDDFLAWGLVRSSQTYLPAFLGATLVGRGQLAHARRVLFPEDAPEVQRSDGDRHLVYARAVLLLAEGRFKEALELADQLSDWLTFIRLPVWSPWRSVKARALHGLGRTEEALALARSELADARAFGAPGNIGRTLALIGTFEGEAGLDHLREALAYLERSTLNYYSAETLVAYGAALRRARRPTEARQPLLRGLELADRCGADGVAETARSELRAAGIRPRTTALQGAESLTASERRVAELAAGGRTNKEIAQTLFVTPKTVEVHLSAAYRKLNIRSRQELERALAA
jgi:DNA-binding CsgD family transcriptional regulator